MLEMLIEYPVEMDVLKIISDPNIEAIHVAYSAGGTAGHYTYTLTGHAAQGEALRQLAHGDAPAAFSTMLDFMLTAVGYTKTVMPFPTEKDSGVCHYIRR